MARRPVRSAASRRRAAVFAAIGGGLGPIIAFNGAALVAKLEGATGTVTNFDYPVLVMRNGLTGPLTINWTAAGLGLTPANGADLVATSGTIIIPDGQNSDTVRVQVRGDDAVELDEGFKVDITLVGGNTITALGSILNDDVPAPVGNGAHRYWRIDLERSADGSAWSPGVLMYEMFCYSPNGLRLDPTSVTGPAAIGGDFTVNRLFDRDINTQAGAFPDPGPCSVFLDFGTPVEIAELGAYTQENTNWLAWVRATPMWSDDAAAYTATGQVVFPQQQLKKEMRRPVPGATASTGGISYGSYTNWRLYDLKRANGSKDVRIDELTFYDVNHQPMPFTAVDVSSNNTYYAGGNKVNLNDGDITKGWQAIGGGSETVFVQVAFATAAEPALIGINKFDADGAYLGLAPSIWTLQFQDDDGNWVNAAQMQLVESAINGIERRVVVAPLDLLLVEAYVDEQDRVVVRVRFPTSLTGAAHNLAVKTPAGDVVLSEAASDVVSSASGAATLRTAALPPSATGNIFSLTVRRANSLVSRTMTVYRAAGGQFELGGDTNFASYYSDGFGNFMLKDWGKQVDFSGTPTTALCPFKSISNGDWEVTPTPADAVITGKYLNAQDDGMVLLPGRSAGGKQVVRVTKDNAPTGAVRGLNFDKQVTAMSVKLLADPEPASRISARWKAEDFGAGMRPLDMIRANDALTFIGYGYQDRRPTDAWYGGAADNAVALEDCYDFAREQHAKDPNFKYLWLPTRPDLTDATWERYLDYMVANPMPAGALFQPLENSNEGLWNFGGTASRMRQQAYFEGWYGAATPGNPQPSILTTHFGYTQDPTIPFEIPALTNGKPSVLHWGWSGHQNMLFQVKKLVPAGTKLVDANNALNTEYFIALTDDDGILRACRMWRIQKLKGMMAKAKQRFPNDYRKRFGIVFMGQPNSERLGSQLDFEVGDGDPQAKAFDPSILGDVAGIGRSFYCGQERLPDGSAIHSASQQDIIDALYWNLENLLKPQIKSDYADVTRMGLRLFMYEGGQHLRFGQGDPYESNYRAAMLSPAAYEFGRQQMFMLRREARGAVGMLYQMIGHWPGAKTSLGAQDVGYVAGCRAGMVEALPA